MWGDEGGPKAGAPDPPSRATRVGRESKQGTRAPVAGYHVMRASPSHREHPGFKQGEMPSQGRQLDCLCYKHGPQRPVRPILTHTGKSILIPFSSIDGRTAKEPWPGQASRHRTGDRQRGLPHRKCGHCGVIRMRWATRWPEPHATPERATQSLWRAFLAPFISCIF